MPPRRASKQPALFDASRPPPVFIPPAPIPDKLTPEEEWQELLCLWALKHDVTMREAREVMRT